VSRREPTHCCPRCGYDLSGAVETWTDQCPVEGVCPECGLVYPWRTILNADFRVDPLFCETATTRLPRALFTTPWRALRPWSFWRWVKMEYRYRPARIAAALVVWFVTVWVIQCAVLLGITLIVRGNTPAQVATGSQWPSTPILNIWDLLAYAAGPILPNGFYDHEFYIVLFAAVILWMMLTALLYGLLGSTLARAKAHAGHIARVAGYQLPSFVVLWISVQLLMHLELWLFMLSSYNLTSGRWHHVSSVPPAIQTGIILTGRAIAVSTVLGVPAWLALHWGFACSRYLRIRRPWLVAIVMLLTSGLAVFTALMYYFLAPGWFL